MHTEECGARDEAKIAAGLHSRDPEVLEDIVRRYEPALQRYLLFLTRSPEDAADLAQETWLRVLERGRQYQGGRPVDRWILAIAHNLAVDRLRTASRKREVALDTTVSTTDRLLTELPSPYDCVRSDELQSRVELAVRRLRPVLQNVIRLRYERELSLDDIAREIKVPPGTVRSRLHRSFSALRHWTAQFAEG